MVENYPMERSPVMRPHALPPELQGWNWGAFFLNWVWGLAHNTWIALLMFVPGVNLVMPFVLGAKGNAWAWANNEWRDIEHFQRTQRIWARVGVGAFVGIPLFFAVIFAIIMTAFHSSTPFEMTMERLRDHPAVELHLGHPIEASWWTSGDIQLRNSNGWAELSFDISGPRGTASVYIHMIKERGAWRYEVLQVIDENGTDILREEAL